MTDNGPFRLSRLKGPLLAIVALCACASGGDADDSAERSRYVTESLPSGCFVLADFKAPRPGEGWQSLNDTVMGGRSSGGPRFVDGAMVFEGTLNTNGGGFASIRLPIEPGVLRGTERIRFKARGDGRDYKVSLRTDEAVRPDEPVAFQASIEGFEEDKLTWGEVDLEDLDASWRGEPIKGAVFALGEVREFGVILADGNDGEFQLIVERIEACRS